MTSTARTKPCCATTCPLGCSSSASTVLASSTNCRNGGSTHDSTAVMPTVEGSLQSPPFHSLHHLDPDQPHVGCRVCHHNEDEVIVARGTDSPTLCLELHERHRAKPGRLCRETRLAIERRRERRHIVAVLADLQVGIDGHPGIRI